MTDTRVDRPQRPAPSGSPDWRDHAARRDTDPELFFPIGHAEPALHQIERAKHVCAGARSALHAWSGRWPAARKPAIGEAPARTSGTHCGACARPAPVPIPPTRAAPHYLCSRRGETTRQGRMADKRADGRRIYPGKRDGDPAACAQMTTMRLRALHDPRRSFLFDRVTLTRDRVALSVRSQNSGVPTPAKISTSSMSSRSEMTPPPAPAEGEPLGPMVAGRPPWRRGSPAC